MTQARAESLEVQCRAAARAELKGPDCRMWMPPNPTSHCNIPTQTEVHFYDNKTLECVKRVVQDISQKSDRVEAASVGGLFHFKLMSLVGTKQTCRSPRRMSVVGGIVLQKSFCGMGLKISEP